MNKIMVNTLKEVILHGSHYFNGIMAEFMDTGAKITVKTPDGIKYVPSPNKGKKYTIIGIRDRAPWNPNRIRATLNVDYGHGDTGFTYLDERFDDELVGWH